MAAHKTASKKQEDNAKKSAEVAPKSAKETTKETTQETQVEKSPETLLSEAVTKKDAAAAYEVLASADAAVLDSLGSNETLMINLADLKGDKRDDCFDILYEHVTSAEALTEFVETKYGVCVGSGTLKGKIFKFAYMDQEADWTPTGLKHLYYSLSLLPKSHVDKVSSITTENTTNGSGGFAVWEFGSYNVNYTEGSTDKIAGRGYCSSEKDYKYNLNSLNCTMVHELGHVVDAGKKYSGRDDFRKISGWKEEGTDAEDIVNAIEKEAQNPYGENLKGEELDIAREGARLLIKNRVNSYSMPKMWAQISDAYSNLGKRTDTKESQSFLSKAWNFITGKEDNGTYRGIKELSNVLYNADVYKHIVNSFADAQAGMPWYKGMRSYMKTRQIHEGYNNRGWYSFSNEAWSQKISMYQFREPGEEFAELYASYHVARPKGSQTSQAHKEWFEKMGLHSDNPSEKETGTKLSPYEE